MTEANEPEPELEIEGGIAGEESAKPKEEDAPIGTEGEHLEPTGKEGDPETKPKVKEEDEIIEIIIGEEDDNLDSKPMRDLREHSRKQARKIKELEKSVPPKEEGIIEIGKEPSMDDEDINYDEDIFKTRMSDFLKKKIQQESAQAQQQVEQKVQDDAWGVTVGNYQEKVKELIDDGASDYDDAMEAVASELSDAQQNIIINVTKNAAEVVLVLGRHPVLAKRLGAITDLSKFTYELALLETNKMRVNKKKPPAPEEKIKGEGVKVTSSSKQLDKLEAEADKTGNRSKVIAFKKKQRDKA